MKRTQSDVVRSQSDHGGLLKTFWKLINKRKESIVDLELLNLKNLYYFSEL